MAWFRRILFLILLMPLWAPAAEAPFVVSRSLSMPLAQQLAIAAAQACQKKGYQVATAVVDRGGILLAFVRDPLAGSHTVDVAIGKAYTAASFQTSTTRLQETRFEQLRQAPKVMLIGGGLPINIGGYMYGAVGVSGAPAKKVTGDVDEACAAAGIDTIREAIEFGSE